MNPQGPDKIPYTDFTWNPCTGCKHGCSYCYARPIANRIYKERFEPTFRPERLKEPFEVTKPSKIFVCDMGDLFGEWMEEEVVDKILDVTRRCTQHTFQFLSKNPDYYGWWFGDKKWLGTTLTFDAALHDKEAQRLFMLSQCEQDGVYWVSAEPLLVQGRCKPRGHVGYR
jgi:protein gp37